MGRTFSAKQKAALYMAYGGKCAMCGKPLPDGWHADHVEPWSAGGETDVVNGQPLCPECNLKKGATMSFKPHRWQLNAHEAINRDQEIDKVVEAPTGTGKTLFAKNELSLAIQSNQVKLGIVVTPMNSLNEQWLEDQNEVGFGLRLQRVSNEDLYKKNVRPEANILVVTYQQLVASPDQLRMYCKNDPVYLVCDELHRLDSEKRYYQALNGAVKNLVRRLGLTATPMRSDNGRIPLMKYDFSGKGQPDFRYTTAEAVNDGLLRYPRPFLHDGTLSWFRAKEEVEATFSDELDDKKIAERLRTALEPHLPYVQSLFERFDRHMRERRDSFKSFGPKALVFARRTEEADQYAHIFGMITSYPVEVIHSKQPDAEDRIFRWKNDPNSVYLISVGMIHTGFNCPKVTDVLVLTTTTYRGWLVQMLGRAMRKPKGGPSDAYVFAPADPRFQEFFNTWEQELIDEIKEKDEDDVADEEVEREFFDDDFQAIMAQIGASYELEVGIDPAKMREQIMDMLSDATLDQMQAIRNVLEGRAIPVESEIEDDWAKRSDRKQQLVTSMLKKIVAPILNKHNYKDYPKKKNPYRIATVNLCKKVAGKTTVKQLSEPELDAAIHQLQNGFGDLLKSSNPRRWKYERIS